MLMKPSKDKSVSLIMAKLGGKPAEAPQKDGAEQDDSVASETAAQELLQAIKADSPKAVVQALKSLMEICESEPKYESEEPQE